MLIRRPEELAWRVFRGSGAVADGLLSPTALRGREWVRLRYDVYGDARLDRDHVLACRATALSLPPYAVIGGVSAASIHGVDHAAEFKDPVHIIVPDSSFFPVRAGLVVHQSALDPRDTEMAAAVRCTNAARTAWDVAAWHDPPTAVSIVDVLLGRGLVDPADLAKLVDQPPTRRGQLRARRALALADGRAQSPPESRVRVRLVLEGLPPPIPQCPVPVTDGVVLHLDLGWPERKVGVEYDGLWHASADQLHRDRRRLNQLAGAGWVVLHLTSERMRKDFPGFIREVRQALGRRA